MNARPGTMANWYQRFLHLGEEGQSRDEAPRVRAIRMAIVAGNTRWMMAANLLNAVVTMGAFWDSPAALRVNIVCSILVAFALLAIWSSHRRRHLPPRDTASIRGTRRAVMHAALLSGLWAAIDVVAYAQADETQRLILMALTVGMAGGGGFALATIPPASIVFCVTIGAGAVLALASSPSVFNIYLVALYVIFAAIIIRSSLSVCHSLTERVRAKMAADEQRDVIGLLLNDFEENAADWLWETDDNLHLARISNRLSQQLDVPENLLLGKRLQDIMPFASSSLNGMEGMDCREQFIIRLEARQSFRDIDICIEINGELAIWSMTGKAVTNAEGRFLGYRGVGRDVTANREARMRIEHLARHDSLTELGNRVLLGEDLARAVTRLERFGDSFSVLLLDLDRFKQVNDTHGHAGGDELLREIAKTLRQLCGEDCTLARLGGDEFAILQMSINDARTSSLLASRIIERLEKPFHLSTGTAMIGVSIGIAFAPTDGTSGDQLMRHADLALYRAKEDGRNRYHFFDQSLDAASRRRNLIENELALAVSQGTLELRFQPLVSTQSGQVVGAEALLRWRHSQLGPISPAEFIPIAEETGMITSIGAWVLREACKLAARWPSHLRVAVNLSSRQFLSPGLLPLVESALKNSQLPPERLELEVTESLLMDSTLGLEHTIKALRGLGLKIALDDFGTGYSSLSYLRRYTFDKLKIDQSFISDIETNREGRAIVESIIRLARDLNMVVVAEGIETEGQREQLRTLGCEQLQGYLLGKPMPVSEFEAHVANQLALAPVKRLTA
ncbi:bifunctional diguanylate cyclase/phosphodiesterase [Rhizobium sp. AAP43]|uniref:putative bifunctional diguanylate cyclase/phosphodiesterase n=1 Tax=Rhizobium sp. AAP43 TaxID=1523420 RepID=UPI001FDAAD7A|nr:EAL domain-containing protein [Rhizobium sp. AAP43]